MLGPGRNPAVIVGLRVNIKPGACILMGLDNA